MCRAAQAGSATQSKQRHLTSPRSLALGLAFLCLPSVCCRNPRLFGLRGKERHLQVTLGEQIRALSACDRAVALCIFLKRLGCAAPDAELGVRGAPLQGLALLAAMRRELQLVVLQSPAFGGGSKIKTTTIGGIFWPE